MATMRSLRNVRIGKVRYKRAVDFTSASPPADPNLTAVEKWEKLHADWNAKRDWLKLNCVGRYRFSVSCVMFENKADAILYLITFG